MLDLQQRLEAIDFLSDCCNDLRLKTLTYQEIGADQVLNLTMSQRDYVPFTNNFDTEERFDDFRMPSFTEQHCFQSDSQGYDYGEMEYDESPRDIKLLDGSVENLQPQEWPPKNDSPTETAKPVNLVMPIKSERSSSSVKKSRRKQMFTRKSVRRISGKSSNTGETTSKEQKSPKSKSKKTENKLESGPMSCRACRTQCTNLVDFERHKDSKKCKPKTGLVCPDCGDKFKFETHYLRHLAGHKENNCKHCSHKISSRAQYRDHLKRAHPDIKIESDNIPCKFCPMSFSRLNRLYSHYQLHHSKGKFVCTSCGLFLPTKEKHREHVLEHDNEKKWKCNLCTKKFYSKNMLTNHLKGHNSGNYRCLTCDITVASKLELLGHKRDKHQVIGLEPKFECEKCHKMFPKKSVLEKHLSTHSGDKLFSCKHCAKAFGTLYGLTKHQKRETHFNKANAAPPESKYEKIYEDQLVCESCGKQYKTYTQLKAHLRIHKTIYKCDRCDKTFSIKENLRRHIKKHDSTRSAVCELCGDSFSRLGGLHEHTQIKHSNARPAQCPSCPKSFKRRSELNRHKRIHDMVRPFVCSCGQAYRQSAHLRYHQKTAHRKCVPETPESIDNDREKNYVSSEHGTLLSLGNFDEHDYRLQETFKVVILWVKCMLNYLGFLGTLWTGRLRRAYGVQ